MILFARKKFIRDERILQIMFILSLLRGSPDYILDGRYHDNDLYHDLSLGTSLGHSRLSTVHSLNELHPKSMDRVLANYQRSLLHDLNYLGSNEDRNFLNTRYNFFTSYPQYIQAYLFNTDSNIGPPMAAPPLEEGGYISGPSSPDPMDEPMQWPDQNNSVQSIQPDEFLEDFEMLENIWKQDVDMGIPRDIFEDAEDDDEAMEEIASKFPYLYDASKDSNPESEPPGGGGTKELASNDDWTPFNFTIDAETGELIATNSSSDTLLEGEGPVLSFNPSAIQGATQGTLSTEGSLHLEFNLDEALQLVGLGTEPQDLQDCEADSGCGDSGASDSGGESGIASLDTLNESLDDMIQASQLHPHHPRNFQSRLGNLVRGGSMEQRWQDLASLLSLPSPDPSHHIQSPPTPTMASHATSPVHIHAHPPPSIHHPHALYPTHEVSPVVASSSPGIPRGVLVHSASIPPTMSDGHNITYTNSIGASSHLVASSMNLTNNTEIASSEHHHYKMETSSSLPPEMMYYQNSGAEMNQSTDGFLSSILSDEDLQLMDIPMTDYNGRATNEYGGGPYRYPPPEDPHRLPQVAQKKHQMFGKRFFHDNPHSNHSTGHNNLTGNGVPSPIVAYPPHYQSPQGNQPMEGATAMDPSEMKYSCSMDFRSPVPEVSGAAVEHVQHNHTYHLSPDGSSGMNRSHGRDRKGRKSELEKSLTRDEKRARSMSLPITCEDIINLPMDEFNERISKFDLTEAQLALIRDIRRRGKNKVAAQNCRKRKLDQIVHLAEEVKVIQYRKNELCSQLDHYTSERARIKHKFSLLYRHIFQSLRDPEGNPYSPHEYSLQQSADGGILLVPRSSPPPHTMDQMNKGRMPKDDGGGH